MRRKTLIRISIVFASILFCVLIFEIYLHTVPHTTILWRDDQIVGRRLVENQKGVFVSPTGEYKTTIEVNKEGWRDTDHSKQKPENTYRIVILGDSFVENFQSSLEMTFFMQMQKNLRQQFPEKNVEIIPLGLGDSGTGQQYIILKQWALEYQPDLVIQLFFSGNDVKNNSLALYRDPHRPYFSFENGNLYEQPFVLRSPRPLYSFVKNNFKVVELALGIRAKLLNVKSGDYPIDYGVYAQEYSEEYKSAWETTKALIAAGAKKVAEHNGNYLLVALANNEQVNEELWQSILTTYPQLRNANPDLEKPDRIIKDFCQENKINCEFMLPDFREFVKNHRGILTHYPKDGHWTQEGTDLVAEFLTNSVANIIRD